MKLLHIPRIVLTLIFALVILTFLTGALRTFNPAHIPILASSYTSGQMAMAVSSSTPTPVPASAKVSADTTGIIALAIAVVVIVLIGATWGRLKPFHKDSNQS